MRNSISLESQMEPPQVPKRALWAAALLYVSFLGALLWFWAQAHTSVPALGAAETKPGTSNQFDTFLWRSLLLTAGSGTAFLLALGAGLVSWRRHHHALQQWRSRAATLEAQLLAAQKEVERLAWTDAQTRDKLNQFDQFARQNAALQAELDQRKRAERSLSQQRQLLESSKTVLELHVQARTAELHTLKHRYELILNSAGEGICGFDLNGKATFVNPAAARLTGWSVEDMLAKTESELFSLPSLPGTAPAPNGAGEDIFTRKDGTRYAVEFVRSRIEEGGQPAGAVLLFKDVTERKRASAALTQRAAELARSNAELEQFAFVASHDLLEPLRKIQAFGDRLQAKCRGTLASEALDYLQRMQSASARMATLIDDLLTFSRVVRKSQTFAQVDLAQVTREVLGDLETRLEKTHGRVEVGPLPTLEADPTQMRQLLLNLIGNALKFQPPGGQPLVQLSSRLFTAPSGEEFCELSVQDNGIGFEEQYAEKIFVVFQRLHGRGEYEGTGIGLAVCRRITDRHHGTITARSHPGHGATFLVTLPLRQTPPAPTP